MESHEITASNETLMRQATYTVMEYAIAIRSSMGEEWCDQNPDAFSRLVLAAAVDFHAGVIGREMGRLTEVLSQSDD